MNLSKPSFGTATQSIQCDGDLLFGQGYPDTTTVVWTRSRGTTVVRRDGSSGLTDNIADALGSAAPISCPTTPHRQGTGRKDGHLKRRRRVSLDALNVRCRVGLGRAGPCVLCVLTAADDAARSELYVHHVTELPGDVEVFPLPAHHLAPVFFLSSPQPTAQRGRSWHRQLRNSSSQPAYHRASSFAPH